MNKSDDKKIKKTNVKQNDFQNHVFEISKFQGDGDGGGGIILGQGQASNPTYPSIKYPVGDPLTLIITSTMTIL